ncbi:hypothetical protein As57867_005239, partial [Aphanomyces stellatus]
VCVLESQVNTDPWAVVASLEATYPDIARVLLCGEDIDFFIHLCKVGGKPVNFIPVIDKDLIVWFKKDSLWCSEVLEAVPDEDAGRVMILHGPMALHHVKTKNEPVGEILHGLSQGVVQTMLTHGWPQLTTPSIRPVPQIKHWTRVRLENNHVRLSKDIHEVMALDIWITELATVIGRNNWLVDMILSDHLVATNVWVANHIPQVLATRLGQRFEVEFSHTCAPIALRIHDASIIQSEPVIEIKEHNRVISLRLSTRRPPTRDWPSAIVHREITYTHKPTLQGSTIHIDFQAWKRSSKLYFAIHVIAPTEEKCVDVLAYTTDMLHSSSFVITADDIAMYNKAVGVEGTWTSAPHDFCFVASIRPVFTCICVEGGKGDAFGGVHLTHQAKCLTRNDDATFAVGDTIHSTAHVIASRNTAVGRKFVVLTVLSRHGVDVMECRDEFVSRGELDNHEPQFEKRNLERVVELASTESVTVLMEKSWFRLHDGVALDAGGRYKFVLNAHYTYDDSNNITSLSVQGGVFGGVHVEQLVGTVSFHDVDLGTDPVAAYLDQFGDAVEIVSPTTRQTSLLDEPVVIQTPKTQDLYARAGLDLNPIHRCPYSAALASLPNGRPLVHGYWTAATARNLMLKLATERFRATTITMFKTTFLGMVYNGDVLHLYVGHMGVVNGQLQLSARVAKASDGNTVMTATASVALPKSAFVFTGQGSQVVGMGMDLYATSPVAKRIWDDGDRHLEEKYGFSILDIVRNNP